MILVKNYNIRQPDYVEKKDALYLLIWKELPHWMVMDEEAYNLIKLTDGSRTLKELYKEIYPLELQNKKFQEIKSFFFNIEKKGLLLNSNKTNLENSIDVSKPILENITVNLTNQCNLRCLHCYLESYKKTESLRIPEFKNFVLESINNKFLSEKANIAILGGEPLLSKEKVIEIAEIGKYFGLEVMVSTNGLLIDQPFAKEAKKNDLVVQVSLDGSREEINSILRGKGNFEKSLNGIKCLIKEGVYTIISMVVHKDNFHDIEDFFYLGLSLGVTEIRYIPLKIMGNQLKRNHYY
ncbi:MAG: radical SAM protein [Promethearchaeota archaeon]